MSRPPAPPLCGRPHQARRRHDSSLSGMPARRLAVVEPPRRGALAAEEAIPLVAAQEPAELGLLVTRSASYEARNVTPPHCESTDHERCTHSAVEGACGD